MWVRGKGVHVCVDSGELANPRANGPNAARLPKIGEAQNMRPSLSNSKSRSPSTRVTSRIAASPPQSSFSFFVHVHKARSWHSVQSELITAHRGRLLPLSAFILRFFFTVAELCHSRSFAQEDRRGKKGLINFGREWLYIVQTSRAVLAGELGVKTEATILWDRGTDQGQDG